MASELPIKANRLNAQKSTGPKAAEGKAVVAQNAVKHGLFAHQNVIHCEAQGEFEQFRIDLLTDLAAAGGAEEMLAERIVSLSWRLQRVERMHSEALDVLIARAETDYLLKDCRKAQDRRAGGLELILGWATVHDFSESHVLERLMDYERRIESSLYKAMGELEKLQRMRKAERSDENSAIPIPMNDNRDEAATHPTRRGQDVRVTRGRDARDTECAKQSQSAEGQKELNDFEKREYELLIGAASTPNEANSPQRRAGVCRY